ncbi:Piso0_001814 [Millerozyma farinosa CBS 7064]|uniref:Piso0_001814 protein n=1 Tax=Pichia sorbitophila (strain ATCC MYA-4447 / BCRC 22081 / CBS 7064 / NBRC 10061 / NRRL Y-12695) TaxID=559304 RepID=G8YLT3_PICSO|nr:Piso0_001814 [Millerozyma farinosa CBS 7064]
MVGADSAKSPEGEELDSTINQYIAESPITTRFREDNPNLHPISDSENEDRSTDGDVEGSMVADSTLATYSTQTSQPSERKFNFKADFKRLARDKFRSSKSIRSSLSRLSLRDSSDASPETPSSSWSKSESFPSSLRDSARSSSSSMSEQELSARQSETPFWKYHVLRFGKDYYLTTNPGLKHVYCRNGPGFYVEVVGDQDQPQQLIFRDIKLFEQKNESEVMRVSRRPDGAFRIRLRSAKGDLKQTVFEGDAAVQPLPSGFIPQVQHNPWNHFRNYSFKDPSYGLWNIGSIPRVRPSRMSKLKHRLTDDQEEPAFKLMGKRNIYFHRNFLDHHYRSHPEKVIFHDPKSPDFPPVLALFRPNHASAKKKISTSFKSMDPFEKKARVQSSAASDKINSNLIDNDLAAGADIQNYYTGGDGLYYVENPKDDTPDNNKLGWITLYDDESVFNTKEASPMFNLVLGLSLAVGIDSSFDQ